MSIATQTDPKVRYLAAFEQLMSEESAAGRADSWLNGLRREAIERFGALGFPTLRTEGWRQINLAPLTALEGQSVTPAQLNGAARRGLEAFLIPDLSGPRLVFVNGHFAPELSNATLPQGARAGSLRAAIDGDDALVRAHLAQHAHFDQNAFTALNTAFAQDGAFVHVPKGVALEAPLHLLFVTLQGESAAVAHPRSLIIVEDEAEATIIEHYAGSGPDVYFNNPVTEIVVGRAAHVDHYKVQQESTRAFHVAAMQVTQDADANFSNLNVALGGRLSRNQLGAVLSGKGIETTFNGLLCLGGEQQVDNVTIMDHAAPNCNSHEVYTGVVDGASRANFTGKIFVRQIAQKTDAKQTNRSLLLSRDASIDSKPQLEIFADDVKCTHGATIGQLNEEAVFYLRARGIGERQARAMLIQAFAGAVTEQVKVEPLRALLDRELYARLSANSAPARS